MFVIMIGQWSDQVLSLDEGLISPCDENASVTLWKREPISDDYLPSMCKAILSISGNVYKQQEMEIDKLINDVRAQYYSS
jgi:hypothetical protein